MAPVRVFPLWGIRSLILQSPDFWDKKHKLLNRITESEATKSGFYSLVPGLLYSFYWGQSTPVQQTEGFRGEGDGGSGEAGDGY